MDGNACLPSQFFLKPGYLMADRDSIIVSMVLGNCVAVTVFDQRNRFGGIHHFVFPETHIPADRTPQYGNVGIPALFKMLLGMGANRDHLVAQIIGGATNRDIKDGALGEKNIAAARAALSRLRVPVVSEDVGGTLGRKVLYHSTSNETAIFKVGMLRQNDWFLPGMDLRFDSCGR